MKQYFRVIATPALWALFCGLVLTSLVGTTHAKARAKSSKQKGKQSTKVAAKHSTSSRNTKTKTISSSKSSAKTARKSVRLSKAERRRLSARRRAIIAARLRAIRARDEALRNSAAANVLNDKSAGEDPEVRRAALDALAGRAGTVVVLDPNDGHIFTVVNQQMALGSPVKPCSTVKLIIGMGALHEGVFDPNLDLPISARYSLNLTDAVAHSNNPFFQVLGRTLGYERVMKYAMNYGFGQTTGANYPGERPGFLPEEGGEETGHMSSHGDGFGVTAMQLAVFTAAIANGGNLYMPRTPRTAEDAANFKPELRRKIEMTLEDRLRILAGMSGTVNFGTGKLAYDPLGQVAGKTGSCTGTTDKLGLFTSFSSVDTPRLVVTVITTGSTEAGKRAAEIAGRVYRAISFRFFKQPMSVPASAVAEFPRVGGGNQ